MEPHWSGQQVSSVLAVIALLQALQHCLSVKLKIGATKPTLKVGIGALF
jgi:hypothetical protein